MMNTLKSTGEQSCKVREDGDASTGSERPLKKARFAWQVKGKYHLKKDIDDSNKKVTIPSTEPSTSEPSSTGQSSSSISESEVEDYLIKHEYSNLDLNPDNSILVPTYNISTKQQQYPKHLSSYERKSNNMLRSNSCNNVKTVSMTNNAEDQCIAQWQASQIKKGCLDNNLNNMFEMWLNPLPGGEIDSRYLVEFAEFMNHLPGANSVENEGILMAISAHGLQNAPSRSNNTNNAEDFNTSSANTFHIPSPLRSLSPTVSDDSQQTNDQQCDTEETLPNTLHTWQCDDQNANNAIPIAYILEPSPPPYDIYDDNHQNSNTDSLEMDSHCDFMNVAILYAIESKGLTASGTEYG